MNIKSCSCTHCKLRSKAPGAAKRRKREARRRARRLTKFYLKSEVEPPKTLSADWAS